MMNGKRTKIPFFLTILLPALLVLYGASGSWAGNAEMIEKNISELDRLNKKIVGRTETIPKNGQISIKAVINPGESLIEYKSRDNDASKTEEGTIQLQDNHLLTFPNKEGEQKHVKEKN